MLYLKTKIPKLNTFKRFKRESHILNSTCTKTKFLFKELRNTQPFTQPHTKNYLFGLS